MIKQTVQPGIQASRHELGSLERDKKMLEDKVNIVKNRIRSLQEAEASTKRAVEEFRDKRLTVVD